MTLLTNIKQDTKEDGFTLIEILVVILIIGILTSIAVPVFLNQRQKANEAALRSDMKTMATAMETWYAENDPAIMAGETSNGWAIIAVGSAGDFIGTPLTGDHYAHGMKPIPLSSTSAIGIVTSVNRTRTVGSYCMVGNAANTKYQSNMAAFPADSPWKYALYYDSIGGGMYEAENIPADGACFNYKMRIDQKVMSGEVYP